MELAKSKARVADLIMEYSIKVQDLEDENRIRQLETGRRIARINRLYRDSGYGICDPASWVTNAGKDQANMITEFSLASSDISTTVHGKDNHPIDGFRF